MNLDNFDAPYKTPSSNIISIIIYPCIGHSQADPMPINIFRHLICISITATR